MGKAKQPRGPGRSEHTMAKIHVYRGMTVTRLRDGSPGYVTHCSCGWASHPSRKTVWAVTGFQGHARHAPGGCQSAHPPLVLP